VFRDSLDGNMEGMARKITGLQYGDGNWRIIGIFVSYIFAKYGIGSMF
jgi:hypothetical protein